MSGQVTVVTGAGSGIGKALSLYLAAKGYTVLLAGRRLGPLEDTAAAHPELLIPVQADVAMPEGRVKLIAALPKDQSVRFVVHNAAVLAPVAPMSEVILGDWRYHMAVNVEAPLFLTQALLPHLASDARILHISSGAAHKAYRGWGAYCTSKAALNMVYRMLDLEFKASGIRVGSARPGVVDTPMQDQVRSADESVFPDLARFHELKQSGSLTAPEDVARFLFWLLSEVEADRFAADEWDIRDEAMHENAWKQIT